MKKTYGGVDIKRNKLNSTILPIVLLLLLLSVFPSLSGKLPIYSGTAEKHSECTLKTKDNTISLAVSGNKLYITDLSTKNGNENRVTKASEYALPSIKEDWIYESCRIEVTDIGSKAEYLFNSESGDLSLKIVCSAHTNTAGPFEFVSEITNNKADDMRLVPLSFASFDFIRNPGDVLTSVKKESGMAEGYTHYTGQSHNGSGIYKDKIGIFTNKSVWLSTFQNWNENGYLPMIYIGNEFGGIYTALEWSSGRINVKGNINGTSVSIDMDKVSHAKGNFSTVLPSGDTFTFPTVYVGAYDGSLDDGSNEFKQWFFEFKVPDILRENENEPLTQMDMQSGLDSYGVEAIKWDYGWWSDEVSGNWKSLEGSWKVRNRDYLNVLSNYGCSSLKEFTDKAKERNITVTTYGLLHDTITPDGKPTTQYGEFNSAAHPDWFSDRCVDHGMGNSADLGSTECVEYLKAYLKEYFITSGVTTWRSDFEPICYRSDKENRHDANGTDVQYWCTKGFGELVDYLYETVTGFRYESCSSGGSMKDLFTATKAVIINCDDAANYLGMRATFYDSSYIIHPTQLQMPCNQDFANPEAELFHPKVKQGSMTDAEFKKAMLDMEFRSQCLGVPMFSSWTGNLQTEYYSEYAEMYKTKIKPLVRYGNLYHILPRPDGVNWDGVMYFNPEAKNEIKGVVFLFKPSSDAGNTVHIRLDGLDENSTYSLVFEDLEEQNATVSGSSLMTDGIDVEISQEVGSEIIWIK